MSLYNVQLRDMEKLRAFAQSHKCEYSREFWDNVIFNRHHCFYSMSKQQIVTGMVLADYRGTIMTIISTDKNKKLLIQKCIDSYPIGFQLSLPLKLEEYAKNFNFQKFSNGYKLTTKLGLQDTFKPKFKVKENPTKKLKLTVPELTKTFQVSELTKTFQVSKRRQNKGLGQPVYKRLGQPAISPQLTIPELFLGTSYHVPSSHIRHVSFK